MNSDHGFSEQELIEKMERAKEVKRGKDNTKK